LGALILIGGSAGDRFGRRRVFALGAAIPASPTEGIERRQAAEIPGAPH
jgi:MFS family permease